MRWPEEPPHLTLDLPCFFDCFIFVFVIRFLFVFFFCFVCLFVYALHLFLWVESCLLFLFLFVNKNTVFLAILVFLGVVFVKNTFLLLDPVFCAFWLLFLEVGMFSLLSSCQRKHNRLFACLDLVLFIVHCSVFSFDFCWFVCPYQEGNPKKQNSKKTIIK